MLIDWQGAGLGVCGKQPPDELGRDDGLNCKNGRDMRLTFQNIACNMDLLRYGYCTCQYCNFSVI